MNAFNKIFISLFVIGLTACGSKQDTQTKVNSSGDQKPKVKIENVVSRDVEQLYEFTASVEPIVKNNINPTTPGRIRQIFVEVGDKVTKGQKLAQMDAVNLVNLETQIDNMKRIYNRVLELHNVGGASQQELDNAKLQLTVAESNLKNLQENTSLISPISGIVSARNYDDGDMYGGQQPILTVMQINPVILKINVSETFFSKVKPGMPVDIFLDVYEGETFKGKVSLVYPTIDEKTRTFGAEITLSNQNAKVRPGMFARVNINFGVKQRVVVPDQAIVKQAGSGARYVYVYKDGKVSFQQVELGRRMDTEYELLSGLESGSDVVVSGQVKLADGTEVEVVK
ncbi:efflux RND transporter periplasmic adaptor subunit [Paludibacter sp.]